MKNAIFYFIIGCLLILTGIYMLINDVIGVGRHYLTQQPSVLGGWLVIFVGVLILVIGYFSLSPFSKIRNFFKKRTKR